MRERFEWLRAFLQEVLQEARRVTWPAPREIASATLVVILAGAFVGAVLMLYDSSIGWVVNRLIYR